MTDHPRCPWCGHDDDCQPGTPGQSPHHFLCCLDRYRAPCLTGDRPALDRIMREEREDKEAS